MSRKITVTQEDIDGAIRNASNRCAVADAIKRSIPDAIRIRVDTQTIRYTSRTRKERRFFLTAPSAQEYIVKFDAGDVIGPFTFNLDYNSSQVIPCIPMDEETRKNLAERAKLRVDSQKKTKGTRAKKVGGNAPRLVQRDRQFGMRNLRINRQAKETK